MNCWGSTIYSPLNVKGIIEKKENNIIFKPAEYACFIKTILINRDEIKKVKKIFKHKFIIELNSGVKYRFIAHNRIQLLKDLYLK